MKENVILEALHYHIKVPCPLQWSLVWFSAPMNLNRKFVNNGTRATKFRDTLTLRGSFLRAVTIMLCYALDKDWKFEEEMQGWCVGEDRLARLSAVRGSVNSTLHFFLGSVIPHWLKCLCASSHPCVMRLSDCVFSLRSSLCSLPRLSLSTTSSS